MKIDINLLKSVEQEANISTTQLIESIEEAINEAYHQSENAKPYSRVVLDQKTGEIQVYAKDALTLNEIGEAIEFGEEYKIDAKELTDLGRFAASTARRIITQHLRDAHDGYIFEEYKNKQHHLVTGKLQQVINKNGEQSKNFKLKINDKFEAFLPVDEQTEGEEYIHGEWLKAYIVNVERGNRGPEITISRSHPGLIRRLFEKEVPELQNKTVEIVNVAREAGSRTKVSVKSNDPNVNPVAALIGELGKRVRTVVEELNGEKIDLILYDENPTKYIANALSPAKIQSVEIEDELNKVARVKTTKDQLTLAIGIDGQNSRLTAKLTGWKIDIKD